MPTDKRSGHLRPVPDEADATVLEHEHESATPGLTPPLGRGN